NRWRARIGGQKSAGACRHCPCSFLSSLGWNVKRQPLTSCHARSAAGGLALTIKYPGPVPQQRSFAHLCVYFPCDPCWCKLHGMPPHAQLIIRVCWFFSIEQQPCGALQDAEPGWM